MDNPNNEQIFEKIDLKILDQHYSIQCPPGESDGLVRSCNVLNQAIDKVKIQQPQLSIEQLILTAALNVSHEVIKQKQTINSLESTTYNKLNRLNQKLEKAIIQNSQSQTAPLN